MHLWEKVSSLCEKWSILCVNQYLPVGGGWAWLFGLWIEINKDLEKHMCLSESRSLCENGSSLSVNGSSLSVWVCEREDGSSLCENGSSLSVNGSSLCENGSSLSVRERMEVV